MRRVPDLKRAYYMAVCIAAAAAAKTGQKKMVMEK